MMKVKNGLPFKINDTYAYEALIQRGDIIKIGLNPWNKILIGDFRNFNFK